MKEVLKIIKKININEKIVIAVSGGPDSMALFDLLLKEISPHLIICAHINHGLRIESVKEEEYIEKYCKEKGVAFEYLVIKNLPPGNFHHEARKIRYDFFEDLTKKYNAKYLLTGHHFDDLLEGIVLRVNRGSGINGYTGMRLSIDRGKYLLFRPLITKTKEEILEYCKQNQIFYFVDHSNHSDRYMRNFIRHNVIPRLKDKNNLITDVITLSTKIKQIQQQFEKIKNLIYLEVIINNKIIVSKISELPLFLQDLIIRDWLIYNYASNIECINNKHISIILNLINQSGNRYNNLPKKKIFRTYDEIYFMAENKTNEIINIEINADKINLKQGVIESINSFAAEKVKNDNNITYLDLEDLALPLVVKNIDLKALIDLKNNDIKKKINRIMIDEKINVNERNKKIMVVDQNGKVVWIPGIKKSKYDVYPNGKYGIILRYY